MDVLVGRAHRSKLKQRLTPTNEEELCDVLLAVRKRHLGPTDRTPSKGAVLYPNDAVYHRYCVREACFGIVVYTVDVESVRHRWAAAVEHASADGVEADRAGVVNFVGLHGILCSV